MVRRSSLNYIHNQGSFPANVSIPFGTDEAVLLYFRLVDSIAMLLFKVKNTGNPLKIEQKVTGYSQVK